MFKGWFVGDFEPNVLKTDSCEVAVKEYQSGEIEEEHYHKVATEITLVLKGRVKMFDQVFEAGTIITVEPGDATAFEALEDAITVVVKVPSVKGDKYLVWETNE